MTHPFPEVAPDFSQPLALLRACHQRIRKHAGFAVELTQQLHQQGHSAALQQAANQVYRYFSSAGQHHHADEEQDLFPILAGRSPELAEQVRILLAQHQQLDSLWAQLAPQLQDLGRVQDSAALLALSQQLAEGYAQHIRLEEDGLLCQAEQQLSQDALHQLGQRMAARRGL
ncbi:MAG: hemerythrin domain-containing protein [Gammaproteobacteria bacterium]|nr:hemerythrin domain-containing protein [Gammaproteobacteria bacterium]